MAKLTSKKQEGNTVKRLKKDTLIEVLAMREKHFQRKNHTIFSLMAYSINSDVE